MYAGQDTETDEELIARHQRAVDAVREASGELKAAAPEVLKQIGIGSLAVMVAIYWFLIKR